MTCKRIFAAALMLMAGAAFAQHGGGGGAAVDASKLDPIPEGKWLSENPYRGNKTAIKIGELLYDGNCARCHGINMISGGFAPDLRELGPQWDEYFLGHIRNGATRNGITYMPAFEEVLTQEEMWAIRSYIDKRHYEFKGKDLQELYAMAGGQKQSGQQKSEDAKHEAKEDQASDEAETGSSATTEPSAAADEKAEPQAAAGAAAGTTAAANSDAPGKLEEIRQAGSIEIAVYQEFPPWSFQAEGGGYKGIDVAIAKALGEAMGLNVTINGFRHDETMSDDIRNMVWKGHYIGRKPADAMIHVGMAKGFQELNDQATFLGAYYNETMGLAYNVERFGGEVTSPLAFAGNKIGVELDTLGAFFLSSAFEGQLRDNAVHFLSVPEAMRALSNAEVAAVVAPLGELYGTAAMLEKDVAVRHVQLTGIYQTDWDVGIAIKAGNPKLAAKIAAAMQELRANGKIKAIFAEYSVPYRPPSTASKATASR